MRDNNSIVNIKNKYFNQNIDIRIQFYHLLTIIGIVTGIATAIIAALMRQRVANVIIDLMVSALSFLLLNIARKKKCYHQCSWILIIVIFMIVFPVLFFYGGGYKSGVPCFFVLAIVFTIHMLEKHERTVALVLEFIIYIACCLCTYYKPETVADLPSESLYVINVTINFIISGIVLLLSVMIRNRMFNIRHKQMLELNRELIARNETLAQYDQMKSDFLATVAHEINTPLAVISASSSDTLDLLKESPLNMEEIMENQTIIERRVKLIDNILLDLMDTVAIENGRISLNRQPVILSELLRIICDAQFKKLDINGNVFTYDLQLELPGIWADPQRIEQVMTNLLSNAIRHTRGGTIVIKLAQTDNNQVVSVTDNGEGMEAEIARIVLKQYVSTKADYWRHGIGLYVCRRIIMAHGGDIWIDSEKGRGTTISFSLREEPDYY